MTGKAANGGAESPTLPTGDSVSNVSNPSALIHSMQAVDKSYRFTGSVNFKYRLSEYLSLATTIAVTLDKNRETFFIPQRGIVGDTLDNAVAFNQAGAQVIRTFTTFNDTRFNYTRTLNHMCTSCR